MDQNGRTVSADNFASEKCRQETGYKGEPTFNSKNYSIYIESTIGGSIEPDCADTVAQLVSEISFELVGNEIAALEEFPMHAGWVLRELPAGNNDTKTFEFSNNEIICNKMFIMILTYDKIRSSFSVKFSKKWTSEDYNNNKKLGDKFNECWRKTPDRAKCMEETGYSDEPTINTKNYSVFITDDDYEKGYSCEETLNLINQIENMLRRFE